jgi:hypothetical protein
MEVYKDKASIRQCYLSPPRVGIWAVPNTYPTFWMALLVPRERFWTNFQHKLLLLSEHYCRCINAL